MKQWASIPDGPVTAMRAERGVLIVDTAHKRYRLYDRAGRRPRCRLVGLIKDLAAPAVVRSQYAADVTT